MYVYIYGGESAREMGTATESRQRLFTCRQAPRDSRPETPAKQELLWHLTDEDVMAVIAGTKIPEGEMIPDVEPEVRAAASLEKAARMMMTIREKTIPSTPGLSR